ncbi:Protein of unknown function [Devosia enhydra]|uniref:Uncharacterized protein n=1 Tax=Devosia enhydra TaxID=665118 RepID=A0A1K2HXR3_9HYPH|nr:Protein of unknown function [Devosia enhydra]
MLSAVGVDWDVAVREQVVAAASRAGVRKLAEVRERGQQAMFEAIRVGRLNSGAHLRAEQQIAEEGFREICLDAARTVAAVEGAQARIYVDALRAPLEALQVEVEQAFKEFGAPGNSPIARIFDKLRSQVRVQMDRLLGDTMDDPRLGLIDGKPVEALKAVGGTHVSLHGHAGQVMVGSPGATQTVQGGQIIGEHPKEDSIVLDFNRAYNPPCSFTEHAVCPLPPPTNILGVRIEAGEMRHSFARGPQGDWE